MLKYNNFLMKKTLQHFLFLCLAACASPTFGQGLIVNEMTNGSAGSEEFVELLVIGSAAAPNAPVNLSGWIIDDNNGEFKAGVGTGVAAGHMRIVAGCYSAVPVGSILIIYNANEPGTPRRLPADDPNDSNGDKVYVIPHTDPCLQACTGSPTTGSTAYNAGTCTYVATTLTGVASWTLVGFRNGGDAVQTRTPNGSFYHGYSYGDVATTFPTFPAEIGGGSSFNVNAATGTNFGYALSCGAFNAVASFSRVGADISTPGMTNDANNSILIQNIQNGRYNYSNPADPNNCALILPLYLVDFQATAYNLHSNNLVWRLAKVDPNSYVNVQRSSDGFNFKTVQQLPLEEYFGERDYNYIDFTPFQTTYYRLEFIEPNAKISYSHVQVVSQKTDANFRLFPNPTSGALNLALATPLSTASRCEIIDGLGRVLIQTELPADNAAISIETQNLPAGHYFFRLSNETTTITRPFIKF
jgi:hypothetical protein